MAKTGGAVKRLQEKAKQYHSLRAYGGFTGQYGAKGETRELIARREESMRDRRAGGSHYLPPKSDKTIPSYDRAMVKMLEPGKHRPIYFGQENRPVTTRGNYQRTELRGKGLLSWSDEVELIKVR